MKIITIFHCFVIIFLTACPKTGLYAETETPGKKEFSYQFTAGYTAGMLYGDSFEIVYRTSSILVSELTWNLKPLFYMGSFLEFSRKNPTEKLGFYSKLSLKFGFPSKTGYMEDRDWLTADYGLSHFSKHDNYTNSAVLLDFTAGLSIPLFSKLVITPYLGFNYMMYKWTARDGYTQYGSYISDNIYNPWDESLPKTNCYGPVVSYTQDWFIFSFGVSAVFPFLERFAVEADFLFSPLIIVNALDDHYIQSPGGVQFHDEVYGGYMLQPSLGFTFKLTPKMQLNLNGQYRYIHNSRGYSYKYFNSTGTFSTASLAGAGYQVWDIGVIFGYTF